MAIVVANMRAFLCNPKRHFGQQCYFQFDVEKISLREWLDSND
jgi:hypothetical protein